MFKIVYELYLGFVNIVFGLKTGNFFGENKFDKF